MSAKTVVKRIGPAILAVLVVLAIALATGLARARRPAPQGSHVAGSETGDRSDAS